MTIAPSHPMAIPSRLALWLGVAFFVASFVLYQIMLAVIGCVFIAGGIFLWLRYHPTPLKISLPKVASTSFAGKHLNRFSFLQRFVKESGVNNRTEPSKKTKTILSDEDLKELERRGKRALDELDVAKKKLDRS